MMIPEENITCAIKAFEEIEKTNKMLWEWFSKQEDYYMHREVALNIGYIHGLTCGGKMLLGKYEEKK